MTLNIPAVPAEPVVRELLKRLNTWREIYPPRGSDLDAETWISPESRAIIEWLDEREAAK